MLHPKPGGIEAKTDTLQTLNSELLSVPSDLRVCLETCLSDTPSQATLERHLPQVRQIIIGLLHGLREKQRLYRDGVAARRAKESQERNSVSTTSSSTSTSNLTGPITTGQPLTPNSAGRSKEDLRRFVNQAQQAAPPVSAAPSIPQDPSRQQPRYGGGERRGASEEFTSAGPRPTSNFGSSRSINSRGGSLRESSRSSRTMLEGSDGGFFSASSSVSSNSPAPSLPPLANLPPLPRTASDASLNSVTGSIRHLPDPERTSQRRRSPPPPPRDNEPIPRTPTLEHFPSPFGPPISSIAPQPIPTIINRPPSVAEPNQPSSSEPPQAASLEALKASDNLSRRASKRYSAYAIQKMTSPGGGGSTGGDGTASSPISRVNSSRSRSDLSSMAGSNGDLTRKRSEKGDHRPHRSIGGGSNGPLPPIPAIPRSFSSQGNLSSRGAHSPITEEDEFSSSPSASPALSTATSTGPPSFPPPPLPSSSSTTSLAPSESSFITHPPNPQTESIHTNSSTLTSRAQSPTFPCSIFLQIGRDVKKARLDESPTIQSLRQLFVERFQYNPGISGWPEIYLRDQEAGVSYELEEMEEVVSGSVLSLNIDSASFCFALKSALL